MVMKMKEKQPIAVESTEKFNRRTWLKWSGSIGVLGVLGTGQVEAESGDHSVHFVEIGVVNEYDPIESIDGEISQSSVDKPLQYVTDENHLLINEESMPHEDKNIILSNINIVKRQLYLPGGFSPFPESIPLQPKSQSIVTEMWSDLRPTKSVIAESEINHPMVDIKKGQNTSVEVKVNGNSFSVEGNDEANIILDEYGANVQARRPVTENGNLSVEWFSVPVTVRPKLVVKNHGALDVIILK